MKDSRIKERLVLQVRFEGFNVLNRTVFAAPAADVGVPQTFGDVTGVTNTPRSCQVAMKFTF